MIVTVERLKILEDRFPEVWLCLNLTGGLVLVERDMKSACYRPLAVFRDGEWWSDGEIVSREAVAHAASEAVELQRERYRKML